MDAQALSEAAGYRSVSTGPRQDRVFLQPWGRLLTCRTGHHPPGGLRPGPMMTLPGTQSKACTHPALSK